MSVRTDVINLTVNVNGNNAQNQLNELKKKAADLAYELKNGLKKGTQEYIDKSSELTKVRAQMDALKKSIGLTSLSQKELRQELVKLNALKNSAVPFSHAYKDWAKQIDVVNKRLYDVNNNVQGFASFFSKINDQVKHFGVLAAGYLGFQFITSQFQNIIKGAGKLSDQLADLRRVAGLTSEEAIKLNSALSKIDTRTSVTSLRDIAIIAGKLGVAKDDVLDFTEAVDKLVVSLGDELGDADQITAQLGKILNVFDGKITGENISKLGNAFVELANTGSATGGFIADFDQRLSGIAKSAGISLGALSGLGAGLEEFGGRVESSATAIQKLIISIAQDIPKAAAIAGQTTEEFDKLFKTDPTEAILKYSEGLVKSKTSFAEVTASFKDAGEEGARTIETISKLGTSADQLRERIDLGKKSIQDTTAITEAFALKNETLGASLDKLGKEFYKAFSSSLVTDALKSVINSFADLIKFLKDLPKFISENKFTLSALAGVLIVLNAQLLKSIGLFILQKLALIGGTVAQYAIAAATLAYRVALLSLAAVQALVTGNIGRARAAWELLNRAFKASPIGIIVAAVIALGFALDSAFSKTSRLQKATEELNKRAIEQYGDQVNKIEQIKKALDSENVGYEQKKKLYQELIAINPEFAKTLQLDAQGHLQGAEAIGEFIKQLKRKGELEAAQELSNEKNKEVLNAQSELDIIAPKIKSGNFTTADLIKAGRADENLKAAQQAKKYFDDKLAKIYASGPATGTGSITQPADTFSPGQKLIPQVDATVAARKAFLEAKIKELQDAYSALNAADKKGQKQNLESQKKFQDELDALLGKEEKSGSKKSSGTGDSEFNRLKKDYAAFLKDLEALKQKHDANLLPEDEKEIREVENKYAELIKRAADFHSKSLSSDAVFSAQEKALIQQKLEEIEAIRKKFFSLTSEDEYKDSLKNSEEHFAKLKAETERAYGEGKISKEQYENDLRDIEKRATSNRIGIALDYSKTAKTAAEDVKKFTNSQEEEITKELLRQAAIREKINQQNADARRESLEIDANSDRPGVRKNARIQIATGDRDSTIGKLKKDLEDSGQVVTDEILNQQDIFQTAWKEFNEQVKDANTEYWLNLIENIRGYIGVVQDGLSSINQVIANKENKQLQDDRKINNEKKSNFKKQLDNKLISKAQYEIKVQAIDDQQAKKEAEVRKKQAQREKSAAIFEAIINTLTAVAKTFAQFGFPAGIPLAAAMAGIGALKVAAISSTPLPEAGKGGLLKEGPYHKDEDKGLHVVDPRTGKTQLLLEKDEMVIKGDATRDNKTYTVTGTPAQIGSKLNSMHGGVSWQEGATIHNTQIAQAGNGALITENNFEKNTVVHVPGANDLLHEVHELIIKSEAVSDTKTYTITGTPAQIINNINSMHVVINNAAAGITTNTTLPEAGTGALLKEGPYHRDKEKGLHVVNPRTGKTELLLEKDEMVIKGDATRDNKTYTVTGTPAQIGSKLNSMHGGVSWQAGATIHNTQIAQAGNGALITENNFEKNTVVHVPGANDLLHEVHELIIKSDAVSDTKTYTITGTPAQIINKINSMHVVINNASASSEKTATAPLPEAGKGGLLKEGPYHKDKDKGLHVVDPRTGKTQLLLEKDEAILKGDAVRDKKNYTVTGTPSQITSKLNAIHGGVNWESGAKIIYPKGPAAPKFATQRPPAINSNMPRIMEQGGLVRPITGAPGYSEAPAPAAVSDYTGLLRELIDKTDEVNKTTHSKLDGFSGRIKTSVSIREIRATEKKYDQARKASGMNQ